MNRISKWTKDGTFVKSWGSFGAGPGQFRTAHRLAFDNQGRLWAVDRGNNRIQIFDQDGNFLLEYKQFGRESGVFIDKNDIVYFAHSEAGGLDQSPTSGWTIGVAIGNARDGKLLHFIPDPELYLGGRSVAEAIAVDAAGNIYLGESGGGAGGPSRGVRKYVKR